MAEKRVAQKSTRTPARYAARVRWIAVAQFVLFTVSLLVMVVDVWQEHFFVTLTARTNADTAVLGLIFILGAYYVVTSFRGFWGALRILGWNLNGKDRESRKRSAIRTSDSRAYICFDQIVRLEGEPGKPISWNIGDEAGKLGELKIDGVTATYYPLKEGMNNGLFEFVAEQIVRVLKRRDARAYLHIVQWSCIDDDEASTYRSKVQAFQNLGDQLGASASERASASAGAAESGGGFRTTWPSVEITRKDVAEIGEELRKLVPALREEAFLPDLEYQVEYRVPVIPQPLSFLQLARHDNRADPLLSIGCAALVMLVVLLVLVAFVIVPPWIPAR